MDLNTKIKIPQSVFIQEIDNETVILDTKTQEYFSINKVGKNIWDMISKTSSLQKILDELVNIYEVPKEQLKNDMINFLEALNQKGLIIIND